MQSFKPESTNKSIGTLLKELFAAFERDGIEYAVARDYESLPEGLEGRDLDIVVGSGEIERAYRAVRRVAQLSYGVVLRIDQELAVWLLVIHSTPFWICRVDIGSPDCTTWRGVGYLNLDLALQRKIYSNGIYQFRRNDIVFMQFCRDIIGRFHLRERYRTGIREIYIADPVRFEAALRSTFGQRCASELAETCRRGNFEQLTPVGRRMRRAVVVEASLRHPLKTTKGVMRYLARRWREYVKPNGILVAVLGPDGSGKGTLIEAMRPELERLMHFPVRTYHWRPHLLPSLGSLMLGRIEDNTPVSNPHAKQANGAIISTLRLAYYTVDYVVGYWFVIRPSLGRKCIAAIFDRYFYDYFVDPMRFRCSLPKWVITLFGTFVPKPDVVFFLSAKVDTIFRRTPELPVEEIERQISALRDLERGVNNAAWVDTSSEIATCKQQMIDAIVDTLRKHLGGC